MGKNRMKADMDVAKMAAQSFLALIFALISLVVFVRKFKYLGDELDKLEEAERK